MRRNLLALVLATEERAQPQQRIKPFFPLLGKSLLRLSLEVASRLQPKEILVLGGKDQEDVNKSSALPNVHFLSSERTGESLEAVFFQDKTFPGRRGDNLVVLDVRFPLLTLRTVRALWRRHQKDGNALTVANTDGKTAAAIFRITDLLQVAAELVSRKKSGSGLPDFVRAFVKRKKKVGACRLASEEGLAVASLRDAAVAMRILRLRKIQELTAKGVVILDPLSTWIDLDVRIGPETIVYPSVVIEGHSSLGRGCRVYPFVHLLDTRVGNRVKILSSTVIEGSTIKDQAQVGPFTHLRPRTLLRPKARVGNFVEMKNTVFGSRSKAGHLSYLGDSVVAEDVNIGAGTITCNYDGVKKHQTVIERGAFIGSGTELVAPVKVGRNAYVGAGSTITKNVPAEALAVARGRQVEKPGWARRKMRK